MKVIIITENNIKEVYGRLKKFFYNNNTTGFEGWYNYDCGFKKHISPKIYIDDGRKTININRYPSPDNIRIEFDDTCSRYITLNLTPISACVLCYGDKIAFCGNRIIFRTKCFWGNNKYLYSVFQVLPMKSDEQEEIRLLDQVNADMWEDYMKTTLIV